MRLVGWGEDSPGRVVGGVLPGRAASVEVGSTTTGLPGTSAAVVNAGTSSAAVLNFTVPRGDVGPQGVPGTPGSVTITGLGSAETIGRLVWTSALGGVVAANGANTWAKIASLSFGTAQWVGGSVLLNVSSHSQQGTFENENNIVSVSVYQSDAANANPPGANVEILGKSGKFNIPDDGFKLVSNGYNTVFELWVRKGSSSGQLAAYEVSRSSPSNLMSVTYHGGSAWQQATPSGSRLNVSSKGVTASGIPVATAASLPLTGDNLVPNGDFSLDGFKYANVYGSDGITTEQARSGTRSFKITGHKYPTFTADSTGAEVKVPCVGGDTFYVEAWIRGHVDNVATTAGVYFQLLAYRADGSYTGAALVNGPNGGTALNGVWTKFSGYTAAVPADAASFTFSIVMPSNVVSTNVYYFDDVKCYRATLPDYAVTTTGAQALSNKTLTSPVINAPKTSGLYDPSYGSLALSINPAHVNPEGYLEIRPSSGEPQLRAMGTGANQNLALYTKGTGTLRVYTDNASAVPTIEGTNGTANSSLNLKTFGTGNVLVNGNLVPSAVAIPATVTTAGKQGQIAFNSSFLYVCVTDNNWRRVALTSW